jgi:hypothetical protein
MILSIAFAQFVIISLGILAIRVLLKAGGYAENVEGMFPRVSVWMTHYGFLLFLVPLLWASFASFCLQRQRRFFNESIVRATGVGGLAGIFAAYFYAAWLLL